MLGKTSSAPGRADGRGFRLHAVGVTDARPFRCFRGMAHRWGLRREGFFVELNGVVVDSGSWLEEQCKRCGSRRPLVRSVPQ